MVVHPCSHRVSRVRRYSGYPLTPSSFKYGALTLCGRPSHAVLLDFSAKCRSEPRRSRKTLGLASSAFVWPPPRSLATTSGISVDVFSCPYLDVSVQGVPLIHLFDSVHDTQVLPVCVPTFGNLRITAHLQLPEAYRSLSRPSSAPDAKAFPLRSY